MASTLRKRLRRPSHLRQSESSTGVFSSPLDPIDLEANGAFSDPDPHLSAIPDDLTIHRLQSDPIAGTRLKPLYYHQRPPPSATLPLVLFAASLFLAFLSSPQDLLRAILVVLLFAPYPPGFPRWTVLIPLLLPMTIKGRIEAILFLILVIWLHVGCNAEWWFVVRRLKEALEDLKETVGTADVKKKLY